MATRRKKAPCEWCEGDFIRVDRADGQLNVTVEIYPENELLSVYASCVDERGEFREAQADLPLEFCPVCGRKLGF